MMREGRIPLNEAEGEAVDRILAEHGPQGSLTRHDSGAVQVEAAGRVWHVAADGSVEQVK